MAKFQKERTDAISEMFDNPDKYGIYPTSKFFVRLDKSLEQALSSQKSELKAQWRKEIEGMKIKKVFPVTSKMGRRSAKERQAHAYNQALSDILGKLL